MNFFAACYFHSREDCEGFPLSRPQYKLRIFRGIVIANCDDVQFFGDGFVNHCPGIHIQICTGRKARMYMKIATKSPEHKNLVPIMKRKPSFGPFSRSLSLYWVLLINAYNLPVSSNPGRSETIIGTPPLTAFSRVSLAGSLP